MYREMAKLQRSTCAPRRVNVRVVISELSLLERGWILRENVRTCNGKKLWRRKKFEQGDNTKNLIIVIISMWNREVICPNNLSCLFIPKNQSSRHLLINNKIINNKFRKRFQRSIRYYQPFIAKLSIYLRIFEYFPSLFPRNPKPLPEKRFRRPFFRWWIKGKLYAQASALSEAKRYRVRVSSAYTEAHSPTTGSERVELKEGFFWNSHASFYTSILSFFFLFFFLPAPREYDRERERREKRGWARFIPKIEVTVVARPPWPVRLFSPPLPPFFSLLFYPFPPLPVKSVRVNRSETREFRLCFAFRTGQCLAPF